MNLRLFFLLATFTYVLASDITIYYFHSSMRCITCKTVENNTKKVIDEHYTDLVKKGTLQLKIINIDDPKNEGLVEKYEVFGSTLILVKKDNNKEVKSINLTKEAFMNARNYSSFENMLTNQINTLMKN